MRRMYIFRMPGNAAKFTVLALLMAAYAAGYAFTAPHTDTAEELLRAYQIRHGIAYPLEGPFLGQALHLGPFWYYLTAIPLWIHQSWLSAALFIGAVCGLQFPLAYWCGKQLVDARFGLLWAVALFYPGWTSAQQLAFLNPNAVAAAVLGLLALYLVLSRRPVRAPGFFGMGIAMGIAIHVHPTAAPACLLALPLLWPRKRATGLVAALALLALGFATPFLPYAWSQAAHGFPDQASGGAYMARQVALGNVTNAPAMLFHYLVSGIDAIAVHTLRWPAALAQAAGWAYVILVASSLLALGKQPDLAPARRVLPAFAGALALFACTVAVLRPTTPVQFTWVLAPAAAALAATGLWSIARRAPGPVAGWSIAAAMVAVNLLAIRAIAFEVRDGEGRVSANLLDIKQPRTAASFADIWFPASAHAELGRLLCVGGRIGLHGHLAQVVDRDLALDTLFSCGRREHLWLGGAQPARHLVGMTRPFWRSLGARPACMIGSLGIAEAQALGALEGLALADGSMYLPRRPATEPPAEKTFELEAPRADAVLLTNMVGRYEAFEPLFAEVDGRAVGAVAGNEISRLYAPPAGEGARAKWRFRVRTTNAAAIDVVSFSPGLIPAPGAPACR